MQIYKILNRTRKIYILKIGQFSIGFWTDPKITLGFKGNMSIGFDAWKQRGYTIKTILGGRTCKQK